MSYRKDWKNAPPPRFQGRGGRPRTDDGFPMERGRGRARARGGRVGASTVGRGAVSSSASSPSTNPVLVKQNSLDMANEEWETASESSDFPSERVDSKNEDGSKKSLSSQRPVGQNKRAGSSEPRGAADGVNKQDGKEKSPTATTRSSSSSLSGSGRRTNRMNNSNRKENVAVYRVDQVVPQDPQAIENAISNAR